MNEVSLKERLDAIWNKNEIACANNLVRWSENSTDYKRFDEFGLYYTKGLKIKLKLLSRVAAIRKHQRLA